MTGLARFSRVESFNTPLGYSRFNTENLGGVAVAALLTPVPRPQVNGNTCTPPGNPPMPEIFSPSGSILGSIGKRELGGEGKFREVLRLHQFLGAIQATKENARRVSPFPRAILRRAGTAR